MRHFLAPHLGPPGSEVTLDQPTSHHLLRVVGIAPGEQVVLADGQGKAAHARLEGTAGGLAVLTLEQAIELPSLPETHLVLSLLKSSAMSTALRMATELGVTHIHPVLASRSVADRDRHDRWTRVLQSATAQCQRSTPPQLSETAPLLQLLPGLPGPLAIAIPGGPPPPEGCTGVVVGPEGGFTTEEIGQALALGLKPMGLGDTVLRADTAVAAALAVLRASQAGAHGLAGG